jgi:hypothetical protein
MFPARNVAVTIDYTGGAPQKPAIVNAETAKEAVKAK